MHPKESESGIWRILSLNEKEPGVRREVLTPEEREYFDGCVADGTITILDHTDSSTRLTWWTKDGRGNRHPLFMGIDRLNATVMLEGIPGHTLTPQFAQWLKERASNDLQLSNPR